MFGVVYYLIFLLIYLISIPLLLISLFKTKYKHSIPARFFLKNFALNTSPHFWFHACSYGEIKSLEPIIKAMPKAPILITTITQTGFDLAIKTYKDSKNIEVKFLPFEIFLPLWKNKLKSLKTLIVTEAELWYMLFKIAKSLGAKTLLINSRISTRSFPRYKKFAYFYRKIFAQIDGVLAQEKLDVKRLQTLGAKNITLFGNLKLLSTPALSAIYPKSKKTTLIAASTHSGEEELILKAFLAFKDGFKNSRLFIAPRHPERFDEVLRLIKKTLENTPYSYGIFSKNILDENNDVILIDTLGELNNLYAISDVVILGGSFAKIGGHNPIEPASFSNKLISGPHIFNQNALFEAIENHKIIQPNELQKTLLDLDSLKIAKIKNQQNNLSNLVRYILQP